MTDNCIKTLKRLRSLQEFSGTTLEQLLYEALRSAQWDKEELLYLLDNLIKNKEELEKMDDGGQEEMFQPVRAKKDESSHWYVVPNHMAEEFRTLNEKAQLGDFEAEGKFIDKFNSYRTGGDLNNEQLFIKMFGS